jgi:hypothetical protein
VRAVPAEGDRLLSNLPCSCSSARIGDDPASQIPVRGARHLAVLTVDDPTAINRVRIAARDPRHPHCLVLREEREEREEGSTFVCPFQEYYRRRLISLGRSHSNDTIPLGSGFLPFPRIGPAALTSCLSLFDFLILILWASLLKVSLLL